MTVSKWVAASVGAVMLLMLLALVFIAGRSSTPAGSNYQPSTYTQHRHYHSSYKHSTYRGSRGN